MCQPASSFCSAHSKRKLNWPSTHFTPRSTRRSARALTRDCRLARHRLGPRPCNSEMLRPSNRFHDRQWPPLYSAQAPDYASSENPYGSFISGVGQIRKINTDTTSTGRQYLNPQQPDGAGSEESAVGIFLPTHHPKADIYLKAARLLTKSY